MGRVANLTPDGTSFGTVAGAVFYDANRRAIDASYGTTIPPNLGANGGEGLFVLAVPKNITYTDVAITAYEGRPRRPDPPAQPFDVSLAEIWAAIAGFHSTKELSGGHVFDADDLHSALEAAFGGQGQIIEGLDTIDQLFVTSGFFEDLDGNFDYEGGELIGPTSHPGYGDQAACQVRPRFGCSVNRVPRTGFLGVPGFEASVSLLGQDNAVVTGGQVYAQVIYPAPNQDHSYGYTVVPDANGAVTLTVPDPKSGATIVLVAIADGHTPTVLGTIDPIAFWAEAATHDGPFLSFTATLPTGDLTIPTGEGAGPDSDQPSSAGTTNGSEDGGGTSAASIAILVIAVLVAVVLGVLLGRRRSRRRRPPVPNAPAAAAAPPPAPPPVATPAAPPSPTAWGPPAP